MGLLIKMVLSRRQEATGKLMAEYTYYECDARLLAKMSRMTLMLKTYP
jgi:hypothetical protein